MKAAEWWRKRRAEAARERRELGERCERRLEVGAREGCELHRDEVQAARPARVRAPRVPCREEIEPDAEAGLDDDVAIASLPARRKAVAREEDVARLRKAARRRVVDVAEGRREGSPVRGALEARGGDAHAHARMIAGGPGAAALSRGGWRA